MNDDTASNAFSALGHPQRVAILRLLVRKGDAGTNIKSVRETLDIPPSTFAHHLRMMSDAGIIRQDKHGREQILTADYSQIQKLTAFLMQDCCADVFTEQQIRAVCC